MLNVKNNFLNLTVCATGSFLAFAMLTSAQTVTLTQNSAYSYSDGGAFNAVTSGAFAQNYAPSATQGGGFQTFCIESTVTFAPNTTYYYDLAQQDSTGRPLTLGAAYLYYDFATGQLAGYTDTPTEAGLLQAAIWELQGGQSLSGFPSYATDPFYGLATNAFGGAAGAAAAANGAYNVDVLQLWDSPTSQIAGTDDHQNQLVYLGASVPDTASTGLLFGLAGVSLVLISRRMTTPQLVAVTVSSRRAAPTRRSC
jgi:hypothetical protein